VTRALLVGYAGFAFLAATFFLWSEPYTGVYQYASVAFYVAAAAISLLVGLLLARGSGGLRRSVIGFEILLVPLQLATSVRSNIPLIGVVLSIAILVLLRPAFPKLSKQSRKFFLTLHVGLAVSWLGAATAMAVLSVTGLLTEDLGLRHHAYAIMHIFDLALVIPLVLLSILTGLVVSLGTHWGLIKNWWVLTKFVIALGIVTMASVKENFWVRGLAEKTATNPAADLGSVDLKLAICMVAFCTALWSATVLSIYKPWGRTPWSERQLEKDRAVAKGARPPDARPSASL